MSQAQGIVAKNNLLSLRKPEVKLKDVYHQLSKAFISNDSGLYSLAKQLPLLGNYFRFNRMIIMNTISEHDNAIADWHIDSNSDISKYHELRQNIVHSRIKTLKQHHYHLESRQASKNTAEQFYIQSERLDLLIYVPLTIAESSNIVLFIEVKKTANARVDEFLSFIPDLNDLLSHKYTAEQQQKQSNNLSSLYKLITKVSLDTLYDWNFTDNHLWRDSNYEILFGNTTGNNPAEEWFQLIHPDDKEKVSESLQKMSQTRKKFWSSEYRYETISGKYKHVLDMAYIFYDSEGNPVRRAGVMRDISQHKQLEQEAKLSRLELQQLNSRLDYAKEEERKRISYELHDDVAQTIAALKMNIEWVSIHSSDSQKIQHALKETIDISTNLMEKIKQLAINLRPKLLDDLGLSEAIKWQIDEYRKQPTFHYHINAHINEVTVNKNTAIGIYRIFQELVNNIVKHAYASNIFVNLKQLDNKLHLIVRDNGCGFDQSLSKGKAIGLIGIRERIHNMNGNLNIESTIGCGTVVNITIPADFVVEN